MTYQSEKLEQTERGVCPCCGRGTYRAMFPGALSTCIFCGWNDEEATAKMHERAIEESRLKRAMNHE